MLIFGSCVVDGTKHSQVALPFIDQVKVAGDLVLTHTGRDGICHAYNKLIDSALERPDCEGLVLLHDDVELVDYNFRPKLLQALSLGSVGVVGVIGASGLRSPKWWEGRHCVGGVFETRGPLFMPELVGDVDVVDGLLMVLSPSALRALRFDEVRFPAFHGYDVDICLQAKSHGLRVLVAGIEVLHRTKTGYGDTAAFGAAATVLETKWPDFITPPTIVESCRARFERLADFVGRASAAIKRKTTAKRSSNRSPQDCSPAMEETGIDRASSHTMPASNELPVCPVCSNSIHISLSAESVARFIVECPTCGVGVTWPPPERNVAGEGLFDDRYAGTRLSRRDIWFREARSRLSWVQLYAPEGALLEIGCATGEFLSVAVEEGYDAYGIEASEWAATHARLLVPNVTTGLLNDWCRENAGLRLDLIAMWHVLEHVPEPRELLHDIARLLRSTGVLALEVPNFDSSRARLEGVTHDAAQLDDHCFHYTPESLASLLGNAGFEVIHTLALSNRVYRSRQNWLSEKNQALLDGLSSPSLDFIRVVARPSGKSRV